MSQRQTVEARRQSVRKYNVSEKGKACQRRFLLTDKGKQSSKRKQAKYHATPAGKLTRLRSENKRRRNLGFNILFPNPFGSEIEIQWHHIDDINVVALPKSIHDLYDGDTKTHREKCLPHVKALYFTDDLGNDTQIV